MDYHDRIENLKHNVTEMLLEHNAQSQHIDGQAASPIWSETLSVLDYAINLSPKNFLNIRFHTDKFTAESTISCWHPYPPIDPEKYATGWGYKFLTEDIPEAYWVSEPDEALGLTSAIDSVKCIWEIPAQHNSRLLPPEYSYRITP